MRACVVIATYDNERTIADVVVRARRVCPEVFVINDGSNDATAARAEAAGATVLHHPRNQGKGAALRTGFQSALSRGFSHALTIDGDGQHDPGDAPALLALAETSPEAIILGQRSLDAMPGTNRFGNRFSNFWVNLAMGTRFGDTQCGFRVYPTSVVHAFRYRGTGYEFETEVLIRQARAGRPLLSASVGVYYPPASERVSHFKPWRDATRIVLLVMRFLFLPRALWVLLSCLLLTSCAYQTAASGKRSAAAATQSVLPGSRAAVAWATPFVAQQRLEYRARDGTGNKSRALFYVVPGSAYRLRVLGPLGVIAFDVAVRCGRYRVEVPGRNQVHAGALADAVNDVSFFPVEPLFRLLAPLDRLLAPFDRGARVVLRPDGSAVAQVVVGELRADVRRHAEVGGVSLPARLELDLGASGRVLIDNEELSLDVPPEAQMVQDIACAP